MCIYVHIYMCIYRHKYAYVNDILSQIKTRKHQHLTKCPQQLSTCNREKKPKFPYTHISQHLYVTYYHIYKDIKTETWPYTTHQFQDDSWNAILHERDLQRKATTTGNRWNHLPSWKLAKMLCVWKKIQHKWRAPLQLGQSFVSHKRHSFCSRIH